MPTIRSLLWIGSGRGLAASGVAEAPELDVTWVPDLAEAARLPRVPFDGVLLDAGGKATLAGAVARLRELVPGVPILVAMPEAQVGVRPDAGASAGIGANSDGPADTSSDGDPTPHEAGVAAVLALDPDVARPGFVAAVSRALDAYHDRHPETAPPAPEAEEATPGGFVARSAAMREVVELVALAASSPSTVLLTGETGAGKEVIARQLHRRSERAGEPFVAINCAAFPEALLESELFGHVRGSFTGADRTKPGLFEVAGAGTLFLDEIAEMELPLQAKLLRVLQEREIRPIGGTRAVAIACRIVAATNRVLPDEVATGHFREDLYYRLNVFPIRVPPLRERRKDVLPLARHFLALHGPREGKTDCHLSLATCQLLESYGWPGNVRELENEMLRVLMLTPSGSLITPKVLSRKLVEILEPVAHGGGPDETLRQAVERVEAWLIRRALANNGGRKASTARRLGLTREGLYKKLKRLGID